MSAETVEKVKTFQFLDKKFKISGQGRTKSKLFLLSSESGSMPKFSQESSNVLYVGREN